MAAWRSAGRSSFRVADPRVATAARAETSSWSPANATTRWCTFALTLNTKPSADDPFTTLQPNLGVVAVGDARNEVSFVVADIPGLIEGAHTGAGLGTQFLRHIERTRLLVHLVDISDASGRPDVVKDVEVILGELASFGGQLEEKPMISVASKI